MADPLPEMAGEWSGSGTAREAPGGVEEAVRCRLSNEWQEDRRRLRVRGHCAVPGRTFEIDGALKEEGSDRLSGFWRNPDGPGQTSISGRVAGDTVQFAFSAKHPRTGRDVSQIITMQMSAGVLRFSSSSRAEKSAMTDIEFRR
jgi:hypothetical protein